MNVTARCRSAPPWLRLLRPAQWSKNAVVPAAYFFARWDPAQAAQAAGRAPLLRVVLATLLFCVLSSGIYVLNDLRDRQADALHPLKCHRPLAAGEISPPAAAALSALLLLAGLAGAWLLAPPFGLTASAYVLLQAAYSFGLKRVALLDIFLIAAGFVLRAVAGAAVIAVRISPWLLLCAFLLALFLALCKRRHEKLLLAAGDSRHRESLAGYDVLLLDQFIAVTAAAVIAAFSVYALSGETARRFGTDRLGLTIPFVIFGLFRYLDLVYRHDGGGRPEKTLLTDGVLMAVIILFLLTALAVFLTADLPAGG